MRSPGARSASGTNAAASPSIERHATIVRLIALRGVSALHVTITHDAQIAAAVVILES